MVTYSVNETVDPSLSVERAIEGVRALAKTSRPGLIVTLEREGPIVIGCAEGRFIMITLHQGIVRCERFDRSSKRTARYSL